MSAKCGRKYVCTYLKLLLKTKGIDKMNTQKNKFKKPFITSLIVMLFFTIISALLKNNGYVSLILNILFVISLVFFIFFCFRFLLNPSKIIVYSEIKEIKETDNYINGHIKHFSGLPIASGAKIEVFIGNDKILFKKEGQEFLLDRSKVISVDYVQGKDANNQAMVGAIAGSMIVGGVSGAFLGSMLAKEYYLIFTYKSEGEIKFISLSTGGSNLPINKIISDFKSSGNQIEERIEL